eukprot:gene444-817_t
MSGDEGGPSDQLRLAGPPSHLQLNVQAWSNPKVKDSFNDPNIVSHQRFLELLSRNKELEHTVKERDEEVKLLKGKVSKLAREKAALASQTTAASSKSRGRDTQIWNHEVGARKDARLANIMKSAKTHEMQRNDALEQIKGLEMIIDQLREEVEDKAQEVAESRQSEQTAEELLRDELNLRRDLEKKLKAGMDAVGDMEKEMSSLRIQLEEAQGEVVQLQNTRQELLARTVKRDHKIDELHKKLLQTTNRLEAEETRRIKADEDIAALDERMRIIRRKNSVLEGKLSSEENSKKATSAELQIKEEECRLLASMVTMSWNGQPQESGIAGHIQYASEASMAIDDQMENPLESHSSLGHEEEQ